jgi:chorismate mutase-like protein
MHGRATAAEAVMDIAEWRKKIDELDRRMVELLNERASAAQEIGRLKRNTNMPIYEPDREKKIFENVRAINKGPLPGEELQHIFERIIDVMRNIQKEEIQPKVKAASGETEFDVEVND